MIDYAVSITINISNFKHLFKQKDAFLYDLSKNM